MTRLAIVAGGTVGTGLRIAVAAVLPVADGWPWATFVVNVVGAAVLGALVATVPPGPLRAGVGTGLLGAFTTFSAFTAEVGGLVVTGRPTLAGAYVAVSLAAGVIAAAGGARLVRRAP